MKGHILLDVLPILFLFVGSHCLGIIESQRCPNFYDANGFLFKEDIKSYGDSISYCDRMKGKPPMPTERSWEEFLKFIRLKHNDTQRQNEGIWIGVIVTRIEDTRFSVVDSDSTELDDHQTKLMFNRDLAELQLNIGEKKCVTYFPPIHSNKTWHFDLQPCTEDRLARTACRCISDVKKYPTKTPSIDVEKNLPEKEAQADGATNSSKPGPNGRAAAGDNDIISNESPDTVTETSTALAAILGMLAACCLIATAYIVAKKRGWNLRGRIAQRMPYNRPSVNGGSYHRGQEMSEIAVSENRPIHVYEEIILRNSGAAQRNATSSSPSSITLPHLPPPEPPNRSPSSDFTARHEGGLSKSLEDGYLQPSFRRKDTISGDVRSPLPVDTNKFTFPPTDSKRSNLLQPPGREDLKYASVETVQIIVDGEQATDEEYLLADEATSINGRNKHFESIVIDIHHDKVGLPASTDDRNSMLNSYVQINGGTSPQNKCEQCQASDSSPVFPHTNEYENDQFLKTVMKVPSVKPDRRGQTIMPSSLDTQPGHDNAVDVYSRIPSITTEPLYSEVKRRTEKNDSYPAERFSEAYTPMRDTVRRVQSNEMTENFTDSDFTDDEASADKSTDVPESSAHEYQRVKNTENTFISAPQMIYTTNKDLANSTLVCYEIPPEA